MKKIHPSWFKWKFHHRPISQLQIPLWLPQPTTSHNASQKTCVDFRQSGSTDRCRLWRFHLELDASYWNDFPRKQTNPNHQLELSVTQAIECHFPGKKRCETCWNLKTRCLSIFNIPLYHPPVLDMSAWHLLHTTRPPLRNDTFPCHQVVSLLVLVDIPNS